MQTEWAIVMHRVPPGDAYAASPNVRFGSKADMCSAKGHVRSTPESGHVQCTSPCLLCANSDIRQLLGLSLSCRVFDIRSMRAANAPTDRQMAFTKIIVASNTTDCVRTLSSAPK